MAVFPAHMQSSLFFFFFLTKFVDVVSRNKEAHTKNKQRKCAMESYDF